MRPDAAGILIGMGWVLDRDFVAYQDAAGSAAITWLSALPQPSEADINAAALPVAKERKIRQINTECRSRLLARYGVAEEQVSRSLGVYGAAEQAAMKLGIETTIDATNAASNAVIAALTEAEVEAVTVTWPVI